jgi:hypothetical protein
MLTVVVYATGQRGDQIRGCIQPTIENASAAVAAQADDCITALPSIWWNWLAAAVAMIITSYLLQLIYFRGIVYVAFGSLPANGDAGVEKAVTPN